MANPTMTELNYRRLTSRSLADVQARPMIMNPDTAANIATYPATQVAGDMVYDTTNEVLMVSNGTAFANTGAISDTWANLRSNVAAEGVMAVATDINCVFVSNGSRWIPVKAYNGASLVHLQARDFKTFNDILSEDVVSANGTATIAVTDVTLNTGTTSAVDYARLGLYNSGDALNGGVVPLDSSTWILFVKCSVGDADAADNEVFIGVTKDPGAADIPDSAAAACNFGLVKPAADATLMVALDDNDTKDYSDGSTGVDVSDGVSFEVMLDASTNTAARVFIDGTDVTATALAAANSAGGETAFDLSACTGVAAKAADLCISADNTTTTTTPQTVTVTELWLLKIA